MFQTHRKLNSMSSRLLESDTFHRIERLAHQPFQHLVGALRKRRGWFLRELSERVSRHLLGMISGQEPARRFLFEEEDCNLLEETEDSPRLIELCSLNEG